MNWLDELKYYHEFMGWNYDSDISHIKTQAQAKQQLKKDLEFIVATDGYGELYESEKELCKKLGIKE